MKKFPILGLSMLFTAVCLAQEPWPMPAEPWFEAQPTLPQGNVQIVEHGDAAQTVAALRAASHQSVVHGWRVRIFFDNSQSARGGAGAVQAQFQREFPDVPSYMTYENPYFKVTVGNCATLDEAVILRGRIEGIFPKAFIAKEDFSIANLAE